MGEKIEMIDGRITFVLIVIISSILSNFFQYYSQGPHLFGGLSGVIYGLLGFCMIIEMESKFDRYGLPALYLFMVIWLILGFMGILDLFGFGKVANFAHLGGLVSGILFAMIYRNFMKNYINMVKIAVLPVAGLGTRFLQLQNNSKEMLPIIDKPLIQYAVEEAINIGVDEIIFITSPEKYSIKKHLIKI